MIHCWVCDFLIFLVFARCSLYICSFSYGCLVSYVFSLSQSLLFADVCVGLQSRCSEIEKCIVGSNGQGLCVCQDHSYCSQKSNPVCATDGQTYLNECFLKITACNLRLSDLQIVAKGHCKPSNSIKTR